MKEVEREAEEINVEESLLDLEVSPYSNVPTMSSTVSTFQLLWKTVRDFSHHYEIWMYGPFMKLDAEAVSEQTENAWRVLYKLTRLLSDSAAARRIAEMTRSKVDKFKQYLSLLTSICNPGLKPRHWQIISEVVGGPPIVLKPESTSLADMIERGLVAHMPQLEEISGSASKEHALENQLRRMQDDWREVLCDLSPYRETGVNIVASVDDVQLLLDDHILRAQTMRGSPYVKAFEADMQAWEEKLISMQDIIDQLMVCQATWMYLEPIFSSEDIMRQMPTEAKNFRNVDRVFRETMEWVTDNPTMLAATAMPEMHGNLKSCNALLEEVQKGLNDYLEKKRLFFPR